jgi:hypothetical protein
VNLPASNRKEVSALIDKIKPKPDLLTLWRLAWVLFWKDKLELVKASGPFCLQLCSHDISTEKVNAAELSSSHWLSQVCLPPTTSSSTNHQVPFRVERRIPMIGR